MVPDQNVYVSFYGDGDGCNAISGNCSAKADVTFAVSSSGAYNFDCALHTYSWDFGDGTHSTDKAPAHRYTADGVYNVKVHVVAGSAAVDLTSTVRITGATPVAPRGGHAVRH
jgi:PKD repeat protein